MAKKPDLSAVKEFLFNHGEKVALGVCGFVAIVLGGFKLWSAADAGYAPDSGKPWKIAFDDAQRKVSSDIGGVQAPKLKNDVNPVTLRWDPILSMYVQAKYLEVPEFNDDKRRNPQPLKILADPAKMRLDYVRALTIAHSYSREEAFVYGVEPVAGGGAGAVGGNPMPMPQPMGPMGKVPRGKKGAAEPVTIPERLKAGQANKFVVVQAVFPMKQQVEEFRQAFKLVNQQQMFANKEDLPRILGINVVRFELDRPGGQAVGKPEIIVNHGPGGLQMQPALEKLLREAMYDETSAEALKAFIYDGLTMPLPRLAYGQYPRVEFEGWKEYLNYPEEPERKDGPDKMKTPPPRKDPMPGIIYPGKKQPRPMPMPMMPNDPGPGGMAADGQEFKRVPIPEKKVRAADKILAGRLFGQFGKGLSKDFNVFHALGQFAPPADEVKNGPGKVAAPNAFPMPGMERGVRNASEGKYFDAWDIEPPAPEEAGPGVGAEPAGPKGPRGKMPPMPGAEQPGGAVAPYPPWERDALVRFIDADVQPGKTYSYAIQVRIANPNFKQEAKVQAAFLAAIPELADGWVTTPSITIPHDYFLYVVDQQQIDEWMKDTNPGKKSMSDIKLPKDGTPFQIQQWVGQKRDEDTNEPYMIGDWAIAGRQVVHKGERIGVVSQIPVPVWKELKEAFEVPVVKGDQKRKIPDKLGVKVKLKAEAEAPVLVDFSGGRRMNSGRVEEETAVEALIMTPDGKLRVQNSRDDADAMQAEAYVQGLPPRGVSREQRWQQLRRRVIELQSQSAPAENPNAPGGIKLPGVGPRGR